MLPISSAAGPRRPPRHLPAVYHGEKKEEKKKKKKKKKERKKVGEERAGGGGFRWKGRKSIRKYTYHEPTLAPFIIFYCLFIYLSIYFLFFPVSNDAHDDKHEHNEHTEDDHVHLFSARLFHACCDQEAERQAGAEPA
jgi:hypothetical protein